MRASKKIMLSPHEYKSRCLISLSYRVAKRNFAYNGHRNRNLCQTQEDLSKSITNATLSYHLIENVSHSE